MCVAAALALASPAVAQEKVIVEGDIYSYFKGIEAPPENWNTLGFDDSGWLAGPSPFGYGDITTGTVITDMSGSYWSLFVRRKFNVADAGSIGALNLRMRYDDGFVAYINGVEVLRKNIPGAAGTPVPHTQAATDHETNPTFEDNLICGSAASLTSGENVLAIEGHNATLTSSDLAIVPELVTVGDLCPRNFTCILSPPANPLHVILRWQKPSATFMYTSISITRDGTALPGPIALGASSFTDRNVPAGTHTYVIETSGCGVVCGASPSCVVTLGGGGGELFRRGDADGNAAINVTDAIFLLNALFQGGPQPTCSDAADTDDNSDLNVTDAIFLLNALFQGGDQPPPPGLDTCGPDPTPDELGACVYTC